MKRPKRITVGPVVYDIDWDYAGEHAGETDNLAQTIGIHYELKATNQRRVLMHEILHAIAWVYGAPCGGDDPEESLVTSWATGILMLWRDNPKLAAFLAER